MQKETVDTSLLSAGQIYKNDEELCLALGESPTRGSKKARLKRWRRFFDFEKIPNSHKIRIIDVYDHPLPKPKQTRNKSAKLSDDFFSIFLLLIKRQLIWKHSLSQYPNSNLQTIFLASSTLYTYLGLVNRNFYSLMSATELKKPQQEFDDTFFGERDPIMDSEFYKFYSRTKTERFWSHLQNIASHELDKNLKRTLKNLRNKIECNIKYFIQYIDDSASQDENNAGDKLPPITHLKVKWVEANDEQVKIIEESEVKALKEVNCKNRQQVRALFQFPTFNSHYKKFLSSYKIAEVRKVYCISVKGDFETNFIEQFGDFSGLSTKEIENEVAEMLQGSQRRINEHIVERLTELFNSQAEKIRTDIEIWDSLPQKRKTYINFIRRGLIRHQLITDDSSPKDVQYAFSHEGSNFIDVCIKLSVNFTDDTQILDEFERLEIEQQNEDEFIASIFDDIGAESND